ncbi:MULTISPECIES: hypothetical protein [unclassified Streptomyces]|uniref:hypothetical protein n=1 Tax=unclassified Streptomyces TaxID=2593676 RepID=UPI00117C330F|nr:MULTISPECIES: hypothetical protein [unclassified Streptomyces]
MFSSIRRALRGARSAAPKMRTVYHWRCECGAHSRLPGAWGLPVDARYNAERHQWRKGVGHPMPEVYSTEEEVPTY